MSEITTFIASKIKTEVKKDANLDWMLPHFVNSKETNEFVCYTFYENLEYWVSSGVATTVYKQPKDNDGNNNFSNYSNKNATAEQTTTPDVDDDIPF